MKKLLLFLLLLFSFNIESNFGQDSAEVIIDMKKSSNLQEVDEDSSNIDNFRELTPENSFSYRLSIFVLIFGLSVIALETILILKQKIKEENTVRFVVVTVIITAALFLITTGYSNNQILPVMGL